MKIYLSAITIIFIAVLVSLSAPNNKNIKVVESNSVVLQDNESVDAFNTMMDVLTHKRCVNCHPSNNIPKQGEDSHPHLFGIQRGENNFGTEAANCNTCHQATNNIYSGVPGAPEWSLAPLSMAWEGLNRFEIARIMLDKSKNGNRSLKELEHHLTEHELVLWAWDPGVNAEGIAREKPPVPKDEYIVAVKTWIEAGAIIPEEK